MIDKKIWIVGTLNIAIMFTACTTNEPKPKKMTPQEIKYEQVIKKTIDDCKEQGVELDNKRTSDFVHKFPKKEIDEIVKVTNKLPKKNCLFFKDEISVEKEEKAKEVVTKAIDECKAFGIELNEEALTKRAMKIPLFVIKKMLAANGSTTEQECNVMRDKFK